MSNQDKPRITGSVINDEVELPPDIQDQIEEAENQWLAHLEWEARLRDLETRPDEEKEQLRQIRELFATAFADQSNDGSELLEHASRLGQIQQDHATRLIEHFETRLDQQPGQEDGSK